LSYYSFISVSSFLNGTSASLSLTCTKCTCLPFLASSSNIASIGVTPAPEDNNNNSLPASEFTLKSPAGAEISILSPIEVLSCNSCDTIPFFSHRSEEHTSEFQSRFDL